MAGATLSGWPSISVAMLTALSATHNAARERGGTHDARNRARRRGTQTT